MAQAETLETDLAGRRKDSASESESDVGLKFWARSFTYMHYAHTYVLQSAPYKSAPPQTYEVISAFE